MHGLLTDRGRATIAAGVTLAAAGMLMGFEDLTRIGLIAVAVVCLALLYVTLTRPRVEVQTHLAHLSFSAGETAALPLSLRPRRRWTPPLRVRQPLPEALGGADIRALAPSLRRGYSFNLHLRMILSRRGRHTIPPCVLRHEDPFGFAGAETVAGSARTLTVVPRTHDLEADIPAGASLRSDGPSRAIPSLPGEEYGSIRDYRPGDDLRRIHWPVTAHRGELMTRHEERTSTRHVLLVLDPRLPVRLRPDVLEWAIEFLASVAVTVDRSDLTLDLLTTPLGAGDLRVGGSADASRPHRDEILHALALVPTRTRPPRLGLAVADPFVAGVREQAAHAGLVVLAAGTADPESTRDLLLSLPPGVAGLAVLVSAAGDDAGLTAVAEDAGWSARLAVPGDSHAAVWRDLVAERAVR